MSEGSIVSKSEMRTESASEPIGRRSQEGEPGVTALTPSDRSYFLTARGFLLFAIAAVIFFSPYFLTQNRTSNYLIYVSGVGALAGLAIIYDFAGDARDSLLARVRLRLSAEGWASYAVLVAFLALYAGTMYSPTPYNEEVRQAVAFVHGHTYINAPKAFIEHAQLGPHSYGLHAPLPAFLLAPFAALWGMNTNQTEFSVIIGALAILMTWLLLGRLRVSLDARVWLTVFFGTGSIMWYESTLGSTWAVPMITAVLFTLITLYELYGAARPFWIGVFAALACLARYDMVLAVPCYAAIAWSRGRKFSELLWIVPPLLASGVVFIWFNEVRYHSFFDVGVLMVARDQGYAGAFGLKYLPGNLYTLLFMAPTVNGAFPYIHPVFSGQSLPLTSPAFVLALRPSFKRLDISALAVAAALVAIPSLFHFTNGFAQFGTRLYLITFPFLLVMMALGMPRRTDQLTKILICVSIFLITFGNWQIHFWGLNGP